MLPGVSVDLEEGNIRETGGSNLDNLSTMLCEGTANSGTRNDAAKFKNTNSGQNLRL
jgi:hypothetical protein